MKNAVLILVISASAIFALTQCQEENAKTLKAPQTSSTEAAISIETPLERGKYLVNALGCDDCHTPKMMTEKGPAPDMNRRFMGHPADEPFALGSKKDLILKEQVAVFSPGMTAAAGPWGISFAANLTPDETGIGSWTEEQFKKSLREGKSKGLDGTRPILPPMPWPNYGQLNDKDISAIFAYFKSMKPINNAVPAPVTL